LPPVRITANMFATAVSENKLRARQTPSEI
jgi:hypothetical protein